MADWPPMNSVKGHQEKEKIYLTLVDMFVDVVEPEIIQMVLQNRNWDLDAALEDIMILSSSSHSDKTQRNSRKSSTALEAIQISYTDGDSDNNMTDTAFQYQNVPYNTNNSTSEPESVSKGSISKPAKTSVKKPKAKIVSNPSDSESSPSRKKTSHENLLPFMEQYNYVKSIPSAFDRTVMLIRSGVKLMVILRGPPGSGKSYLARQLLKETGIMSSVQRKHVFSSDEFFVRNNIYIFIPEQLAEAHMMNQCNVATAIKEQVSPIIVDNTNTQAWEMKVYAEMAVSAGYDIEILEPNSWWFTRENELSKRNIHGVPKAKIRIMLERYEKNITPNKLLKQFQLRYSLSNAPPQPTRNSKWRDKFNSQKNNKPKKKKNDFNPNISQPNNFVNFNGMLQSLPTNSANFLEIPNTQSSLNFQSENFQNSCFPKENNSFNCFEMPIQSKNLLQKNNGDRDFVQDIDTSSTSSLFYDLANSQVSETGIESSISSKKILYQKTYPTLGLEGLMAESSLKMASSPINQLPLPLSNSKFNENNTKEQFGISFKNDDDIYYEDQASRNSFDFMAESSKLLADFCRQPTANKDKDLIVGSELPFSNLSQKMLVCKDNEIIVADVEELNCVSNSALYNRSEQNETSEIKDMVAKELADLIIDKVVSEAEGIKSEHHHKDELETSFTNVSESSLEYVVVKDNEFLYKRLNPLPIPSHPTLSNKDNLSPIEHFPLGNSTIDCLPKNSNCDKPLEKNVNFDYNELNCIKENEFQNLENIVQNNFVSDGLKNDRESDLKTDLQKNWEISFENESEEVKGCGVATETHSVENAASSCAIGDSGSSQGGFCNLAEDPVKEMNSKKMDHADVLGMMKDILDSMVPNSEQSSPTCSNEVQHETSNFLEVSSNQIENSCHINTLPTNEWDSWASWSTESKTGRTSTKSEVSQPKPARNLTRQIDPASKVASVSSQKHKTSTDVGTWDSVCNSLESWETVENGIECGVSKTEDTVLPQRLRMFNKPQSIDSFTNTNYLDFSLLNDEIPTGVKVLTGTSRNITTANHFRVKSVTGETLLLDKSTMTSSSLADAVNGFDINQISTLFPNIPEKYILDMIEKCQGDIDWAVDLLLDSEHRIYSVTNDESKEGLCISKDNKELRESSKLNVEDVKTHSQGKSTPKRECKSPNTLEQAQLKKIIESCVVFGKCHYSDKVLKVLKKKHPEYLSLIESSESVQDKSPDKVESVEAPQEATKLVNEVGGESVDSGGDESSNGGEVENEDDTLDLAVNNDLILQLQQKFGFSNMPGIANMSPVVKLPVSLARQLYGYIMDSLQTDMEEQQNAIETMIAQDEEIAKLLQYQDQNMIPKLQEIMDLEIALAVHKADQEEWEENSQDTVAAKLSKNILLEKFPHADPKMLMEVLHVHKYSLHDTIASLTLALDYPQGLPGQAAQEQEKMMEEGWMPLSDSGEGSDPMSAAQTHRQQAATYYSLRMECLSKAHEAFRAGNKTVATYYSQLAQLHKEKVEHCNSRAAACLLSTHKCGTHTLDLHFLHVTEAEVVLDMFLDEAVTRLTENSQKRTSQRVFLITGRGLRSIGGVSRIKPMVQKKLQIRGIIYTEVNPGMLCALIRTNTALSCTLVRE